MADILNYFPLNSEIRDKQADALKFIEKAVKLGYTDIVVQAPTGIGKSAIGVCAGFWMANEVQYQAEGQEEIINGAYYLITQKLLQDQLSSDSLSFQPQYRSCASIKTSEEYPCEVFGTCGAGMRASSIAGKTAEKRLNSGKSLLKVCPAISQRSCSYRIAKDKFLNSTIAITNYPYFFTSRLYTDDMVQRKLLVLDEAHTVETQVIRFIDASVSQEQIIKWVGPRDIPNIQSLAEYSEWLESVYIPKLILVYENMLELSILTDSPDEAKSKELVELDKHICKIARAISDFESDRDNWIFWREDNRDKTDFQYIARPVFGARHATQFLKPTAKVRLYMSAYLGAKEIYCRNLGLNPSKTAWLSLDSDFPIERRKVHSYSLGSMSMKSKEASTPAILRAVVKIAKSNTERGIIHGHSYELCKKIFDDLTSAGLGHRLVFPKNADEREESFGLHGSKEGSILISPSMTTGFDFKEDLARWQILPKIPYQSLSCKQTVARLERDPDNYVLQTLTTIIQACGRICRSESDFGITFILDSDLKVVWEKAERLKMIPNWWKKAVIFH